MRRVLAIDQGTTSSRAIIYDSECRVLGVGQREFSQSFPQPGWVEHNAEEIWISQWDSVLRALKAAGCSAGDIDAVGITNQRETTVVWNRKTGLPEAPAIVWQDRRTAKYCDEQKERWEPEITRTTGLLLDPYFSGTKLRWLLKNVPGLMEKAERGELCFGTVESWLVWKLTGGRAHITDVSNASRTLLMDLRSLSWDSDILGMLEIPEAVLPKIVPSSGVVATTDGDVFGAEVPISGLAGDQQAALFGQRCFTPGTVKNTYGTGCFLLANTGEQPVASANRLLTTVAWQLGDAPCQYALEGSVFTGGSVVQWLRDGLRLFQESKDVNELAADVDDCGGVYMAPAFTGLGAPHWDPYARGMICGLTRGSTAGHIARAALESIAFQVADVVKAMAADAGHPIAAVRVDGGASRSDLLLQIQADLLGCKIERGAEAESTALGAALLAGLGVGLWKDLSEIEAIPRETQRFERAVSEKAAEAMFVGWNAAVKRSLGWAKEVP